MLISFVVPTLNEHGNIERLIKKINEIAKLNKIQHELIVIDDNSKDGTIQDVKNLQKTQNNINLIVRKNKVGIGSALRDGYNNAKGDLLFSIDGDLSHPPDKIPEFIRKIKDGCDMVMSSRYIPGGSVDKNIKNYMVSKMGAYYLSIMFRINIKDFTTAYRIIRKELWEKIKNYKYSNRNVFLIEMVYYAYKNGGKLGEIPIFFKDREIGSSKTPLFRMAIKSLILPITIRINSFKKSNKKIEKKGQFEKQI